MNIGCKELFSINSITLRTEEHLAMLTTFSMLENSAKSIVPSPSIKAQVCVILAVLDDPQREDSSFFPPYFVFLSLMQGLRVQLCNELLFLVYTECESVADELILAAPSIPGDRLLDFLTSLLPFKLRNRVTDKVDVSTIPLDCAMVKWLLLLDRVSLEAAHL